ncbi:MAG: efflux RND transporter permease subunit [Steroidobacteraceae bacterium]|jgi:multidrug efflux pump|nr:efflux RND transporter permease subunit [Steroidobacteraceae bacterium]
MTLSDLSIRRPVFASVVSLLLVILGLMAALRLPIREYPDINRPVVSVSTAYRGANASVIESRVTQVLEDEIAGIEGVEKLTSSSRDEFSRIAIEFALDRDLDAAANDVRERVSRAVGRLPQEADAPQVTKVDEGMDAIMYVNVSSSTRDVLQLNDYVERYLIDRLGAVAGVAAVRAQGGGRYAMRIWLDREALAARQLTVTDVENALRRENVELPAGRIESREREFTLRTDTSMRTEEDFRNLVVGRGADDYLVRLGEVAEVRLAAEDVRTVSRANGLPGVSLGVVPTSKANVLEVAQAVRREVERMQPALPKDLTMEVNLDFTVFVVESMRKVVTVLVETLLIVLVVIFVFLGTLRATLIPAVTIPVSIMAAAMVMAALGYSINTLTLLGAVLAIGLVVDDAIVVLENIARRIELGEPSLVAAMNGSREIGFAVIATTLVLMAVFVPVSYMEGMLGRLFGEFGVTVAAAVGFSALVALTLTPMLASKLFAGGIRRGRLAHALDGAFRRMADAYEGTLRAAMQGRRPLAIALGAAGLTTVLISLMVVGWPVPWLKLKQEFAPTEDRAMMPVFVTAPEGASLANMDRYMREVESIMFAELEAGNALKIIARSGAFGTQGEVNVGTVYMPMTLWDKREESAQQVAQRVRARTAGIAGARIIVITPPSLGIRGVGKPLQVVLGGGDYAELARWRDQVIDRIEKENPRIVNLESDYQERKPQLQVRIDRNRAADLGVSLQNVGRTLETMLGSRIVTTFMREGEEYNVILQAREEDRATVNDLGNLYVKSERSGEMVPLSALVTVDEVAGPSQLKRFDRLRSITITANLAPGYSLAEALDYVEELVRKELPGGPQLNYDGESRELKDSGGRLWVTFAFALLIVYLVLAAQFESFVHPLVILATVPLAITGALIGLWLFNSSINVFSQIGGIMLIGIACKNGILIVEFANQLRDRGIDYVEAVIEASAIRLRPVLMTSLCTAFGAVPLMIATGAGAESRHAIGAAVFFGTAVSLALTLYVVPALYALIARNTTSPHHVSDLIEKLTSRSGAGEGASPGPAAPAAQALPAAPHPAPESGR